VPADVSWEVESLREGVGREGVGREGVGREGKRRWGVASGVKRSG
jgi:hypothetical protein